MSVTLLEILFSQVVGSFGLLPFFFFFVAVQMAFYQVSAAGNDTAESHQTLKLGAEKPKTMSLNYKSVIVVTIAYHCRVPLSR